MVLAVGIIKFWCAEVQVASIQKSLVELGIRQAETDCSLLKAVSLVVVTCQKKGR